MKNTLALLVLYLLLETTVLAQTKPTAKDYWDYTPISLAGKFCNYWRSGGSDNEGTDFAVKAKVSLPSWQAIMPGKTALRFGIEGSFKGGSYNMIVVDYKGNHNYWSIGGFAQYRDRYNRGYNAELAFGYARNSNTQVISGPLLDNRAASQTYCIFYLDATAKVFAQRANKKKWLGEFEVAGGLTFLAGKEPMQTPGWKYDEFLHLIPYYSHLQSYGQIKMDMYDMSLSKNNIIAIGFLVRGTRYDHEFGVITVGANFKVIAYKIKVLEVMIGQNLNQYNINGNNLVLQTSFDAGALYVALTTLTKK